VSAEDNGDDGDMGEETSLSHVVTDWQRSTEKTRRTLNQLVVSLTEAGLGN
jgi:hypothetical protein